MARDTVDKAVEVGALNDPRGCQTDGFILEGGEAWQPTSFIRLVQDYGIEVEVCKCVYIYIIKYKATQVNHHLLVTIMLLLQPFCAIICIE